MSEAHSFAATPLPLHDPSGRSRDHGFARAVLEGLARKPKRVPSKYFYDARGSELFEEISALPEYYQTRTELALLAEHAKSIAGQIGTDVELIEFGAGALKKVRLLLDALERPLAYIPIDISGDYLMDICKSLGRDYPALRLHPVVADFTRPFALPALGAGRRVGFFPGSTIGNFRKKEAVAFLRTAAGILKGGGLLIGVDLVKDPAVLHAAYNDAAGVTASFNKNILARANRELAADFDLDAFAHHANYNPLVRRIEMYLVSLAAQRIRVAGETVEFAEGEAIHTEDSYKHTVESFREMAHAAGFLPRAVWVDSARLFSVHWLETA